MSKIQESLSSIKARIHSLVVRFEQSDSFEKLFNRYDSLEPRQQEWMRFTAKVFVLLFVVYLVFSPLKAALESRQRLSDLYALSADVDSFVRELAQRERGYRAAKGWMGLPASSSTELSDSLGGFLSQIGIPEDFFDIQSQGSSIDMRITELSLRQLKELSFQIDGFFPAAFFSRFHVSIHPENKELLQMDASIEFVSSLVNQIPVATTPSPSATRARPSPPRRSQAQRPRRSRSRGFSPPTAESSGNARNRSRPSRGRPSAPSSRPSQGPRDLEPPPEMDQEDFLPGPPGSDLESDIIEGDDFAAPDLEPPPDLEDMEE